MIQENFILFSGVKMAGEESRVNEPPAEEVMVSSAVILMMKF